MVLLHRPSISNVVEFLIEKSATESGVQISTAQEGK